MYENRICLRFCHRLTLGVLYQLYSDSAGWMLAPKRMIYMCLFVGPYAGPRVRPSRATRDPTPRHNGVTLLCDQTV